MVMIRLSWWLRGSVALGLVALALLALAGCSPARDYATAANAFAEEATRGTIVELAKKHDTELMAYAAAYCGQPRIGAVARRYQNHDIRAHREQMCAYERQLGFGP